MYMCVYMYMSGAGSQAEVQNVRSSGEHKKAGERRGRESARTRSPPRAGQLPAPSLTPPRALSSPAFAPPACCSDRVWHAATARTCRARSVVARRASSRAGRSWSGAAPRSFLSRGRCAGRSRQECARGVGLFYIRRRETSSKQSKTI